MEPKTLSGERRFMTLSIFMYVCVLVCVEMSLILIFLKPHLTPLLFSRVLRKEGAQLGKQSDDLSLPKERRECIRTSEPISV